MTDMAKALAVLPIIMADDKPSLSSGGNMELKMYLQVLLRKWWIVALAFLITFISTVVFTLKQSSTYKATATFVVAPVSLENKTTVMDGLAELSRQAEIVGTYAEVASSRFIKREAAEALNLSSSQEKSFLVRSKLRAGTNVLEITVEGNDPVLAGSFANTIGDKTVAYVQPLYEVYRLNILDHAIPPAAPERPNKGLNLALGAIVGLALGGGLAFLSDYLQPVSGKYENVQ